MTDHAKIRALERGISKDDIVRIINDPAETIYDNYEENYKSYGIITDPYNPNRTYYVIIVHNSLKADYVAIITVMITGKGGLKTHGFSNI